MFVPMSTASSSAPPLLLGSAKQNTAQFVVDMGCRNRDTKSVVANQNRNDARHGVLEISAGLPWSGPAFSVLLRRKRSMLLPERIHHPMKQIPDLSLLLVLTSRCLYVLL